MEVCVCSPPSVSQIKEHPWNFANVAFYGFHLTSVVSKTLVYNLSKGYSLVKPSGLFDTRLWNFNRFYIKNICFPTGGSPERVLWESKRFLNFPPMMGLNFKVSVFFILDVMVWSILHSSPRFQFRIDKFNSIQVQEHFQFNNWSNNLIFFFLIEFNAESFKKIKCNF